MNAGKVVLFGGPAGAGKSTLAARWCGEETRAAHIQLDHVRQLIVQGLADPQRPADPRQAGQYSVSVAGCCALAHVFASAGYSVAIDDVLDLPSFEGEWEPRLVGLDWSVVIVLPSLAETLARSAAREKRVIDQHIRQQHAMFQRWPRPRYIDTTGLSIEESLVLVRQLAASAE